MSAFLDIAKFLAGVWLFLFIGGLILTGLGYGSGRR